MSGLTEKQWRSLLVMARLDRPSCDPLVKKLEQICADKAKCLSPYHPPECSGELPACSNEGDR